MRRFWLFAAGTAALALGPAMASAQMIAPGYHMEREFFHSGAPQPGAPGREVVHAPDQDVPSFTGETHVPSLSAQGRGSDRVEVDIIDR